MADDNTPLPASASPPAADGCEACTQLRQANAVPLAACREALAFVGDPSQVMSAVATKRRVTTVLRQAIAAAAGATAEPEPPDPAVPLRPVTPGDPVRGGRTREEDRGAREVGGQEAAGGNPGQARREG